VTDSRGPARPALVTARAPWQSERVQAAAPIIYMVLGALSVAMTCAMFAVGFVGAWRVLSPDERPTLPRAQIGPVPARVRARRLAAWAAQQLETSLRFLVASLVGSATASPVAVLLWAVGSALP
jgi:hypothetical protein